jgi:hypothetical protein
MFRLHRVRATKLSRTNVGMSPSKEAIPQSGIDHMTFLCHFLPPSRFRLSEPPDLHRALIRCTDVCICVFSQVLCSGLSPARLLNILIDKQEVPKRGSLQIPGDGMLAVARPKRTPWTPDFEPMLLSIHWTYAFSHIICFTYSYTSGAKCHVKNVTMPL